MKEWTRVPDDQVRHIWALSCGCAARHGVVRLSSATEGLKARETAMEPQEYETSGTPICAECGEDMSYIRTEIKK